MFKNLFKIKALGILAMLTLITSCSDELSTVDVDNYVIESTYDIQKNHMVGKPGCYELVFPVTLNFPDSSSAEVDSYEDMKETIRAWKEGNPEVDGRPKLDLPVDVLTQEGELVTIEDKSDLRELIKACREAFRDGPRDHHRFGRFRACFDLVFPITLALPNGMTVEVESYRELKHALRVWRHNNPGSTDKPSIQFPVEIEYGDGSTQTINSADELKAAKKACRD